MAIPKLQIRAWLLTRGHQVPEMTEGKRGDETTQYREDRTHHRLIYFDWHGVVEVKWRMNSL